MKVHTLSDELRGWLDKISEREQQFLIRRSRCDEYDRARTDADKKRIVQDAVYDIQALRKCERPVKLAGSLLRDPRWELLQDLHRVANPSASAWSPVEIGVSRPVGFYTGEAAPPMSTRVQISFDSRLAFRSLARYLRENWRKLLEDGIVEDTQPLGERKVAVLSHVCLVKPEASWEERFRSWNRKYPQWRYRARQDFITACHDAEESLTGNRHGLAWFYNAKTKLRTSDLVSLARQGDKDAIRELERRKEAGIKSLGDAGTGYVYASQLRPRKNIGAR